MPVIGGTGGSTGQRYFQPVPQPRPTQPVSQLINPVQPSGPAALTGTITGNLTAAATITGVKDSSGTIANAATLTGSLTGVLTATGTITGAKIVTTSAGGAAPRLGTTTITVTHPLAVDHLDGTARGRATIAGRIVGTASRTGTLTGHTMTTGNVAGSGTEPAVQAADDELLLLALV